MNLYELTNAYSELQREMDAMDVEEMDSMKDTLDAINDAIEVKADNICALRQNLLAEVDGYKKEIDRLNKLKDRANRKADNLKLYLHDELNRAGIRNLKTGRFALSFRKSTALDVFGDVPEEYCKMTLTADKTAIRKAIQEGVEFSGARLVENMNLQIK